MDDELRILEENLNIDGRSKDTIKKYKSIARKFLNSKEKNVLKYAENLKYKDEVSHFKSVIKEIYDIDNDTIKNLKEIHSVKKKRRRKLKEDVSLLSVMNTINAIRNKKLKLAFRLSAVSGLRVKELADLKKQDLIFDEDEKRIVIHVEKGKGNKQRDLWTIFPDEYLYKNLKELVADLDDKSKVFYSRGYLLNKAKEYNFQNHDLRANCVNTVYLNSSENTKEVIEVCQDILGHSRKSKTYLSYLGRAKKINQARTKFDL